MGYVNREDINGAVNFLLPILQAERSVRYSRFYDGSDETHATLMKGIGQEDDFISPELLMDLAVDLLVEHGVVRRVFLDAKLMDDEPDYRIDLIDGQPTNPIRARDLDL